MKLILNNPKRLKNVVLGLLVIALASTIWTGAVVGGITLAARMYS